MGLAQGFEFRERHAGRGKGPGRGHRPVHRRGGRQRDIARAFAQQFFGAEHALCRSSHRAKGGRQLAHQTHHLAGLVAQGAAQHLDHADAEGFAASGWAYFDLARFWRGIEEHVAQRHGRLAIDCRVVHLRKHAHLFATARAAWQAFDDVHAPQGFAAVQQLRVQLGDGFFQQRAGVWGRAALFAAGQLVLDDVIAQVRLCIDPGGVGQVEGHPPQPPAQCRRGRHARRVEAAQRVHIAATKALGQFEQVHGAHVHGHFGCFQKQKARVQSGQLLDRHGSSPGGWVAFSVRDYWPRRLSPPRAAATACPSSMTAMA